MICKLDARAAGILLAVSSLPSPYGIGSFGEAAREWLRFLKDSGQKYWQILPLGPTGWGDSPYQSFSAFALSSYYIDLDILIGQGLLLKEEVNAVRWGSRPDKTDYGVLYRRREPLLRVAAERFKKSTNAAFDEFCSHNQFWLEDYSLFMSLKKKYRGRSWLEWDEAIKLRKALQKMKKQLAADMYYHSFAQYTAYTQWLAVREYAHSLDIAIIGDIPIYVAEDSADTWANGELFLLDEDRKPLRVAGCPPDPFSANGQLWGNPLYRWDYIAQNGFAWWLSRLRFKFVLYDIVRIDHFRGFESFYSIDAANGAADARNGEWVKGPGLAFIETVNRELPGAAIIAEDLGYLTPEVKALLKASGYSGMKVLQFAFDSREPSDYLPWTYERNCAAYTGTHDNPTSLGWFASAPTEDVKLAMDFFGIKNPKEGCRAFIRCVLASAADTAIIPIQDYLCLDNRARMNTPSTLGNWHWRMLTGGASPALAEHIRRLADIYGRTGKNS
jgi:4-alpha-glucanotransferase